MLKRWEPLTRFLDVPGAPLDNNVSERAPKEDESPLTRKAPADPRLVFGQRPSSLAMSAAATTAMEPTATGEPATTTMKPTARKAAAAATEAATTREAPEGASATATAAEGGTTAVAPGGETGAAWRRVVVGGRDVAA